MQKIIFEFEYILSVFCVRLLQSLEDENGMECIKTSPSWDWMAKILFLEGAKAAANCIYLCGTLKQIYLEGHFGPIARSAWPISHFHSTLQIPIQFTPSIPRIHLIHPIPSFPNPHSSLASIPSHSFIHFYDGQFSDQFICHQLRTRQLQWPWWPQIPPLPAHGMWMNVAKTNKWNGIWAIQFHSIRSMFNAQ